MPKRNWVDPKLFGWKPLNYVNGVPWPRLPMSTWQSSAVPLKEDYLLRSMDYLDTDEARIIFEAQADIIQKHRFQGIVDVGCRTGPINTVLQERGFTNYNYMGFDTSLEPILFAQRTWGQFENIEFRHTSWDHLQQLKVDFKVDCVVWSGVLLYRPHDHLDFFHKVTVEYYNASHAIIQEPLREQKYWHQSLSLNTIADDLYMYQNKYHSFSERLIDAEIFGGRRKIVELAI